MPTLTSCVEFAVPPTCSTEDQVAVPLAELTGTFASERGLPIRRGEVLRRRAVHDNSNVHVAAMGFWVLHIVRDDGVGECEPLPDDVLELRRPASFDPTPNYGLKVPQLSKPRGVHPTTMGQMSGSGSAGPPGALALVPV